MCIPLDAVVACRAFNYLNGTMLPDRVFGFVDSQLQMTMLVKKLYKVCFVTLVKELDSYKFEVICLNLFHMAHSHLKRK